MNESTKNNLLNILEEYENTRLNELEEFYEHDTSEEGSKLYLYGMTMNGKVRMTRQWLTSTDITSDLLLEVMQYLIEEVIRDYIEYKYLTKQSYYRYTEDIVCSYPEEYEILRDILIWIGYPEFAAENYLDSVKEKIKEFFPEFKEDLDKMDKQKFEEYTLRVLKDCNSIEEYLSILEEDESSVLCFEPEKLMFESEINTVKKIINKFSNKKTIDEFRNQEELGMKMKVTAENIIF